MSKDKEQSGVFVPLDEAFEIVLSLARQRARQLRFSNELKSLGERGIEACNTVEDFVVNHLDENGVI